MRITLDILSLPRVKRAFDRFVDVSGGPDACWPWTGGSLRRGYGKLGVTHKRTHFCISSHRAAWFFATGEFLTDDATKVCHRCDNKRCCNQQHMFLGTALDNAQDAVAKRLHNFGEKNGRSKLTEADVVAIRLDPRSKLAIAKQYGVSDALVGLVKRREAWKHVA